jgi:hypothetical protein
VVETDDPALANLELVNFFASNEIAWSEVTEPMPEPLHIRQQQVVTMSRLQRETQPHLGTVEPEAGLQLDREQGERAAMDGPAAPFAPDAAVQTRREQVSTLAPARTGDTYADRLHESSRADGDVQGHTRQMPQQPQSQIHEADNLIVARGMSMRQAEELQKSLYQPHAKQRAQVVEQVPAEEFARQRARQLLQSDTAPRAGEGPRFGQLSTGEDAPSQLRERREMQPLSAQQREPIEVRAPQRVGTDAVEGAPRAGAEPAPPVDETGTAAGRTVGAAPDPPASSPPADRQVGAVPQPSDESRDLPHELPLEYDAADPADQVDVYVIILQNALPEPDSSGRDTAASPPSDVSDPPAADPPAADPAVTAESADDPQ